MKWEVICKMKKKPREDIALRAAFRSAGWIEVTNIYDKERQTETNPTLPLSFKKGNTICWHCSRGWAVADITSRPQHYENHRYYPTLQEVLDRETKTP